MPNQPPPAARPARLAALGLAVLLVLASCGSSTDDPPAAAPDSPDAPGAEIDPGSNPADGSDLDPAVDPIDVCAGVTSDEVAEILDITIKDAAAIPGVDGSCQYLIDIGGIDAAVVQILTYPPGFLDGQRELQTDPVELPEIGGFTLPDGSVLAPSQSGAVSVIAGVELTEGGPVASTEQLTAIATLAREL